jgi:transcriptional regulator with XRE-family HTH domain
MRLKGMTDQTYLIKRRIEIGQNIRNERRRRGLSQEEAAELLGCSRARVNRVEKGHTEFGVAELELLASQMRVPLNRLISISSQQAPG